MSLIAITSEMAWFVAIITGESVICGRVGRWVNSILVCYHRGGVLMNEGVDFLKQFSVLIRCGPIRS